MTNEQFQMAKDINDRIEHISELLALLVNSTANGHKIIIQNAFTKQHVSLDVLDANILINNLNSEKEILRHEFEEI